MGQQSSLPNPPAIRENHHVNNNQSGQHQHQQQQQQEAQDQHGQEYEADAGQASNVVDPFSLGSLGHSLVTSFSPIRLTNASSHTAASPLSSSTAFPHLTAAQLQSLKDSGADLDLCFVPYQMPRLPTHSQQQQSGQPSQKQKETKNIINCMSIRKDSTSISRQDTSHLLTFQFDSTVPCTLKAYLLASDPHSHSQPRVSPRQSNKSLQHQHHASSQSQRHLPTFVQRHIEWPIHKQFILPGMNTTVTIPLDALLPSSISLSTLLSAAANNVSSSFFSATRNSYPIILHFARMEDEESDSSQQSYTEHETKEQMTAHDTASSISSSTVDHLIAYICFTQVKASASTSTSEVFTDPSRITVTVNKPTAPSSSTSNTSTFISAPTSSTAATSSASSPSIVTIGVKVIRQKIVFGSQSYEIKEIFGLRDEVKQNNNSNQSLTRNTSSSGQHALESLDCVICLSNRRSHVILPCRHLCLCEACAIILREQSSRCPMCRRVVQSVIPVFPSLTPSTSESALHIDQMV